MLRDFSRLSGLDILRVMASGLAKLSLFGMRLSFGGMGMPEWRMEWVIHETKGALRGKRSPTRATGPSLRG
jgi:hypothetical protein